MALKMAQNSSKYLKIDLKIRNNDNATINNSTKTVNCVKINWIFCFLILGQKNPREKKKKKKKRQWRFFQTLKKEISRLH
jgi:hypothetical protein